MSDIKTTTLNIKREFFKYISLSILGLIGTSCYILIDTYFISKGEGNLGLTALNVAIPAFYVMNATGLMISIGGATKYSITGSNEVFTHSLIISVIFSIIFLVIGMFFPRSLSALLGADNDVIDTTASYLRVLFCFSPAFMLNNLFMAFVRNDNKPHLVTVAMTLGSLFNIVFDYIFIFTLGLGMFGAALATGFSPAISLLVMSLHKIKKQNSFHIVHVKPTLSSFAQISAPGISTFITELANSAVVFVFNIIILKISGNIGVAAYGIVANIAMIVMALFTGLTQGMQPLLSREYGLGHKENVKKLYRMGITFSLFLSIVVYVILFLLSYQIISIFNSESNETLTNIAYTGIHLYFLSLIFTGFNIVKSGYYSAVNYSKYGFVISILRGFVIIIPTVFILSNIVGINGVWISLAVADGIVFFICCFLPKPTLIHNHS